MLLTAESPMPLGGRLEGSFDDRAAWAALPVADTTRSLRIYLGDAECGPLVWLFDGAPMNLPDGEPRPDCRPVPTHLHRSPTFRIALGEQPHQFKFDGQWFGSGDYILLDANRPYSDPNGVDGLRTLLIFADRRGMHPVNRATRDMSSEEMIMSDARFFGEFGAALPAVHLHNDDAIKGVEFSTGQRPIAGRVMGNLYDQTAWSRLSDGSRVVTAVMCDQAGPAVLLSRNAPGAVEAIADHASSDTFRTIVDGSCRIGGQTYAAGTFIALEAGQPQAEVIHGDTGSTQILFVADRRRFRNELMDRASSRDGEIAALLRSPIADPAQT